MSLYRSPRNSSGQPRGTRQKPPPVLDDRTLIAIAQMTCASIVHAVETRNWDGCARSMFIAATVMEATLDNDRKRLEKACKTLDRIIPVSR